MISRESLRCERAFRVLFWKGCKNEIAKGENTLIGGAMRHVILQGAAMAGQSVRLKLRTDRLLGTF